MSTYTGTSPLPANEISNFRARRFALRSLSRTTISRITFIADSFTFDDYRVFKITILNLATPFLVSQESFHTASERSNVTTFCQSSLYRKSYIYGARNFQMVQPAQGKSIPYIVSVMTSTFHGD